MNENQEKVLPAYTVGNIGPDQKPGRTVIVAKDNACGHMETGEIEADGDKTIDKE